MAISKGIQTSEFALVVVVNIAAFLGSITGVLPPKWMVAIVATINAVYAILRTLLKIFDPSFNPPDLPPLPGTITTTTITASPATTPTATTTPPAH